MRKTTKKIGLSAFPFGKQSIEITLQVIAIFLGGLLLFSITKGQVDLTTMTISLMMTYICVHFWRRHLHSAQTYKK